MRVILATALLLLPASATPPAITLVKPIACDIGATCFIQQYMDHDAGPGAKDYQCHGETYDGHDGTDFRLPDKLAQARGVAVVAAAAGVVRGVRDGEADFAAGAFDRNLVKGKECGNGVVIEHDNGWQTQYCHMRQGSVEVRPGQRIKAGDSLGLVGQSGDAAFVHLHLTVRHDGKPVDPFAPDAKDCGGAGAILWSTADRAQMAYRDAQVLNAGFAAAPVTMDDIERGGVAAPDRQSPALVAYVRVLALRQGDRQGLIITGPDGVVAEAHPAPADHDKAQAFLFTGKKRSGAVWSGAYSAHYTVERDGKVVLKRDWTVRF